MARQTLAAFTFMLLSTASQVSAQSYQLIALGNLPDGNAPTWAAAINDDGWVVGQGSNGVGTQAILWAPPNYAPSALDGDAASTRESFASDINASGLVAGAVRGPDGTDAAIWDTSNRSVEVIGRPAPEFDVTIANSVNVHGQLVGTAREDFSRSEAWYWDPSAREMTIMPPDATWGRWQSASDLTDQGLIVGVVGSSDARSVAIGQISGQTVFTLQENFPDLRGLSYAGAINETLEVVGSIEAFGVANFDPEQLVQGYLWQPTRSQVRPILDLDADIASSAATSLNDRGYVTGSVVIAGEPQRAFLWSEANGTTILNDLIDPNISGLSLKQRTSMREVRL